MPSDWSLIGKDGRRKYLVDAEYAAFMAAVAQLPPRERAFCEALAGTGARISEVLALRKRDIDRVAGSIVIKSLKKRKDKKTGQAKIHHRAVPVKPGLIATLDLVFDLTRGKSETELWPECYRTGYRWVMKAMESAGLEHFGPHSLRHTFGTHCVMSGVALTSLKKWLGHENIDMTSHYATPCDAEERKMAERMWR